MPELILATRNGELTIVADANEKILAYYSFPVQSLIIICAIVWVCYFFWVIGIFDNER